MEVPDVVEDGVGGRPTSAISRRRVQRGALSVITTQRTISTRQHPVVDETDPEVTFKTLSRAKAAAAKPSSRTTATRGGIAMASGRVTDWAQCLDIGLNTPTSTPTFGRGAFTPTGSGRGALVLSGSGRDIMKFEDPGYIDVRRNELPTPGRPGRSSRASTMSIDMEVMQNRQRQEMEAKVGAFEKKYELTIEEKMQKLQQEYQRNDNGVKTRQQQMEQDFADVEHQREALKRESVRERTILNREREEMKNITSEVQQQPEQQEREMERRIAQQMNEIARRAEKQRCEMAFIRAQQEFELVQKQERQEREIAQKRDLQERRKRDVTERREQERIENYDKSEKLQKYRNNRSNRSVPCGRDNRDWSKKRTCCPTNSSLLVKRN